MRLYLKLSESIKAVPFNYQHLLTGCLHKWIGENNAQHGKISLYSFSWIQNTETNSKGFRTTNESYFFINFYQPEIAKKVVDGIMNEPEMFSGIKVLEVIIKEPPVFENKETFIVASPILIKRSDGTGDRHYTFEDHEASALMTETLQAKLELAGLSRENVLVHFDDLYPKPKTKLINYKGIKNRANLCPIVISGSPEQIAFAWTVGIGNSTGIGFGSLK